MLCKGGGTARVEAGEKTPNAPSHCPGLRNSREGGVATRHSPANKGGPQRQRGKKLSIGKGVSVCTIQKNGPTRRGKGGKRRSSSQRVYRGRALALALKGRKSITKNI